MTEYEIVGRSTKSDEAPLAENAEWCESYPFRARPADHEEWYEMYAYEGYPSYAYSAPAIEYQEWCYVTPTVPLQRRTFPFSSKNGPFQGQPSIIKGVFLSWNVSALHSTLIH